MTSTPSQNWPKQFLLQIHAEAVKHGFIWIEDIDEGDARSLTQRLYRIRRRSDTATASFIPPEYHLVNIGAYDSANRRIPVIFSRLPDGRPLPQIRIANSEEIAALTTMQPTPLLEGPPAPAISIDPAELQLDETSISGLVERMKADAQKKVN